MFSLDIWADLILLLGTVGLAVYCFALSKKLRRFSDLEKGVGGAIAALSVQVDGMTEALQSAKNVATKSNNSLEALTGRADGVARRLELLVASMHDLPSVPSNGPSTAASFEHATTKAESDAASQNETVFQSHRSQLEISP